MRRQKDTARRPGPAMRQLLALLDEAFDHPAWHGPSLLGSLRGVTEAQAARRPGRGRHNIWEIAVHAAYWKWLVARRLTGMADAAFPLKGTNWFRCPAPGRRWKDDVAMLVETHAHLREVVAAMPPRALSREVKRGHTAAFTIRGIAAHDVYHAGQVGVIKKLVGLRAQG